MNDIWCLVQTSLMIIPSLKTHLYNLASDKQGAQKMVSGRGYKVERPAFVHPVIFQGSHDALSGEIEMKTYMDSYIVVGTIIQLQRV